MSVSQSSVASPEVSTIRWGGWALAAAGTLAGLARVLQPSPLWSSTVLVLAVAALAVAGQAPEAFETRWRGGARRFNPAVGAPALFLLIIGLTAQVDDFALPAAGAAVGAAILLIAGARSASRPGLASPLAFQIIMAVLGAALGYGAIVTADVDYDRTPPTVLPTPVLGKYSTYSRSGNAYHLRLPPFGDRPAPSTVTVDSATYAGISPGAIVCVAQHRGALGLPWVAARLC